VVFQADEVLARAIALVSAFELPLVLLVAPALLFPTPQRLALALLVPVTWACHWKRSGAMIPAQPMNLPILALLGMAAISLAVTFDTSLSLPKVSGLLLGVLVYVAATRLITTDGRLQVATAVYLGAGVALALVGILGANWAAKFPAFDAVTQRLPRVIRGVPGAEEGFNANAIGGSLVLFIPLQASLLLERLRAGGPNADGRRWDWWLHAFALVLTAGTLLLTESRGAWMALAAASGVVLVVQARRPALVGSMLILGVASLSMWLGIQRVIDAAISSSGIGMAQNISGRIEMWSRALTAIGDFPITGLGMNTFRRLLPTLYPMFTVPPSADAAHTHNHFLQAALDLGIPGLIAYSAVWILLFVSLQRVYRHASRPAHHTLAVGIGGGLLAHFLFGMTDAIPLGAKVGVLFWLTLALAAGLDRVALRNDHCPAS
jgi:putative inorganic carbon (HCO3(-)) transporter